MRNLQFYVSGKRPMHATLTLVCGYWFWCLCLLCSLRSSFILCFRNTQECGIDRLLCPSCIYCFFGDQQVVRHGSLFLPPAWASVISVSWVALLFIMLSNNNINPGSQIPQVEARKRCSRDLFTSSGRATALIDRHFLYTFLQQSMTRLNA